MIEYIKEQTPEICMAAVQLDETALYYIEEQTPELCMLAFKEMWVKSVFKNRYIEHRSESCFGCNILQ